MKNKIIVFFIFIISIVGIVFIVNSLRTDYINRKHFKKIEKLINSKTEKEKKEDKLKESKNKCDIINEEYDKVFNTGKFNRKNFYMLNISEKIGEVSFLIEEKDMVYQQTLTMKQIKDIKDIIFEREYE